MGGLGGRPELPGALLSLNAPEKAQGGAEPTAGSHGLWSRHDQLLPVCEDGDFHLPCSAGCISLNVAWTR